MTKKITWKNYKSYDHATILNRMKIIEKNMNGLLPLYGKEKKKLIIYAKKNNLPLYEMISLRNTIRIQKEINYSKRYIFNIKNIQDKFINLVNDLSLQYEHRNLNIFKFFKTINQPFNFINRTIKKMPEYKMLSNDNINFIKNIENSIKLMEIEIRERSMKFENTLEKYLKYRGLNFRTENDIKRDKDYNVTPDILFNENIILQLDGIEYSIRWMDAKNYILTNTPFIIKSLQKQAAKYNNIFGMGAFVFHYGFDSSIKIDGVIILDGSKI